MIRAAALAVALIRLTTNDHAIELLRVWITAVDEHVPGEQDAALERIGQWREDEVELMLDYVQVFAGVRPDTSERARRRTHVYPEDQRTIGRLSAPLKGRGNFDRFLTRAALLHTDLAMFGSARVTSAPPPPGAQQLRSRPVRRVDVLSNDGRVEQYQLANPHWEFARDLLDALPKKPRVDPVIAAWYRAIGAHLMRHRSFAEAVDHFRAARTIVPDEPDVLYGEACLQEIFGAPRIQDYVRIARLTGVNIGDVWSPQTHFKSAAELLRKAVNAQPGFVEARLRLGRILVEQKNYPEAIAHLQRVTTSTDNATLRYYAFLFLGDASLAIDRASDARTAYERALDLFPRAQAAHLGLGASLRLLGERQTAIDAVMSTVMVASDARDETDEPWWDYYDGDEAEVERLLVALRAPYRERTP